MLPESTIDEIITGFYEGTYSVFNMPTVLYAFTAEELDGMFFSGFGDPTRGNLKEIDKAVNFRGNLQRFSGAKTFQESKELTEYVFDENGRKRPFAEFKRKGLSINEKYNVNYLRTEQDTAFLQSQNARKFMKFESEAEIFPILKYVTVGDERVRHSHAKLDGLKAPVNDPIWNSIMPQNGYGCRCIVIQLEETRPTSKAQVKSKTKPLMKEFKKNPDFDYNAGKSNFIFKENGKGKHDYFKVPRQFNKDLKNNFGFPPVTEITGRHI